MPAQTKALPIKPGDLIILEEADYCYGRGKLRLRITKIAAAQIPANLEWLPVLGMEIGWDGTDRGQRYAVVRVDALAEALRAGETWESSPATPG